ncbi:hypothetical protein GCM10010499_27700 [Streptomyces thermoviolaceus subsp. apingens]|nr:hypothetical protein GCM10010499_27700 [Streptomyces thermoviolaceus subsp. apingens]
MGLRQHRVDASARFVGHFVRSVLDELEKLTVAVSPLGDATFAVGMLGDETGVHGVGLQDTFGLFENGFQNCGRP